MSKVCMHDDGWLHAHNDKTYCVACLLEKLETTGTKLEELKTQRKAMARLTAWLRRKPPTDDEYTYHSHNELVAVIQGLEMRLDEAEAERDALKEQIEEVREWEAKTFIDRPLDKILNKKASDK